jgi:hypothetical protein
MLSNDSKVNCQVGTISAGNQELVDTHTQSIAIKRCIRRNNNAFGMTKCTCLLKILSNLAPKRFAFNVVYNRTTYTYIFHVCPCLYRVCLQCKTSDYGSVDDINILTRSGQALLATI